MDRKMNDIVKAFHEYFQVVSVNSPDLLREVFRLRYQAFCVEARFPGLDKSHYPDGLEMDDYDPHSSHVLLQHRPSGRFVGTVRLILCDPLNPGKPFPTEKYMNFDPALIDKSKLPRQQTAEVSRFLLLNEFNKRKSDRDIGESIIESREAAVANRRRFPHSGLALVVGAVQMSAKHNITHWLAMMEPTLNRLLCHYGAQLNEAGPSTNHHGVRQPYYVKLTDMLDRMYAEHREVWELVTDHGQLCLPPAEERKVVGSY